jgi:hypothetical protein
MTIQELTESKEWKNFIKKLEKFSSLILLVGIVLYALKFNENKPSVIIVAGFSSLAIVYFFDGFKELKSPNFMSSSFFKIYGWGLAISCISMMFVIMKWPINENCLIISTVLILAALLLGLKFKNEENKDQINKLFFIRLIVALILLSFVYYKTKISVT